MVSSGTGEPELQVSLSDRAGSRCGGAPAVCPPGAFAAGKGRPRAQRAGPLAGCICQGLLSRSADRNSGARSPVPPSSRMPGRLDRLLEAASWDREP